MNHLDIECMHKIDGKGERVDADKHKHGNSHHYDKKESMNKKQINKGIHSKALLPIPKLKGKTISVGVRVTPKLRADAMSKARLNGDAMVTANTWAGLVRKWAFDYLGHPERYTWSK